jgi:hypothetical protein
MERDGEPFLFTYKKNPRPVRFLLGHEKVVAEAISEETQLRLPQVFSIPQLCLLCLLWYVEFCGTQRRALLG